MTENDSKYSLSKYQVTFYKNIQLAIVLDISNIVTESIIDRMQSMISKYIY